MKRYPARKDSGVAWIGEIPEGWECVKTKSIANSIFKGNGITKEQVTDDGDIQCVRYGEIYSRYNGSFENAFSRTKISSVVNPRYISYGDILFAGTGELVGEIGKNIVYIGNEPCIAGGDIIILKHSQNPVFLNYALSCPSSQFQKSDSKAKLKVVHISASEIGNIFIALPPLSEQDQIVHFLDWKVSGINRLISVRKKQIATLEELKKAVISKAVTKGLDPHAKMKDSSVSWIGEIPEGWGVTQIRRVYLVILGKMLAPTQTDKSQTLEEYVCAKDIHFDGVDLSSLRKMWFSDKEKDLYKIQSGDLLVVEGGAAGNSAIVPDSINKDIFTQNSVHIIRPQNSKTTNAFLYYWMYSLVNRGYMKFICSVATIPHFTKEKVLSTVMPLPSISEQGHIVAYLDAQTAKINATIDKKKRQIELLQELKTRLIADVVTGKIDVRGVEIPEYEYAEEEADAAALEESEERKEEGQGDER